MYDRKTDTYWSQLDGLAIVGELTGMKLKMVRIDTVTWGEWKTEHSDSEVLSRETGFPLREARYGIDPYGGYYESDFIIFPVENEDDRIHAKTVIFGVEIDGAFIAYREDDLEELKVIEDTIGEVKIRIEREVAGTITATNLDTGEEIIAERSFWFAWYAFHPETELFGE
jgi:hypothetical protein